MRDNIPGLFWLWASIMLLLAIASMGSAPPVRVGRSGIGADVAVGFGGKQVGINQAYSQYSLLVRSAEYPNTAAADSGFILGDSSYDLVLEADDASAIRWGCISSSAAGAPYSPNLLGGYMTRAAEDDRSHPVYASMLAFKVGSIPADSRIDSAFIAVNIIRANDLEFGDGFLSARLDTVAADYHAVYTSSGDTINAGADANFMNTSYNEVSRDSFLTWTPPLNLRDDWHDFGVRGKALALATTIGDSHAVRIDVTDAVQQLIDRGNPFDGWALFWVYHVGTTNAIEGIMFSDTANRVPTGNPCLAVYSSSRRGSKAWGEVHVPVVMTVDDGHIIHSQYRDIMAAAGKPYSEVAPGTTFMADGGVTTLTLAQRDSIYQTSLVDIVLHSYSHGVIETPGGNSKNGFVNLTSDEIQHQLWRAWASDPDSGAFSQASFDVTGRDSTYYIDFAWPGNGADSTYTMTAVPLFVKNGYRSARAATEVFNGELRWPTKIGLDSFVNVYNIVSPNWTAIFGTAASPFTVAAMRDTLMDYIDDAWTDGRAPLIFYGHRGDGTPGENGTYEMVQALVDRVNEIPGCDFMSFREVMSWRIGSAGYVDPEDVTSANGADAKAVLSAALYDSLYQTDGDSTMRSVWVGPIEASDLYNGFTWSDVTAKRLPFVYEEAP